MLIGKIGSIAHQAACHGKLTEAKDCGHLVLLCQSGKLFDVGEEKRIGANNQAAGMQFGNLRRRSLELAFGASIQKINLQSRLEVLCLGLGKIRASRIDKNGEVRR